MTAGYQRRTVVLVAGAILVLAVIAVWLQSPQRDALPPLVVEKSDVKLSVRRKVSELKEVGEGMCLLKGTDEIEFLNDGQAPLVLPMDVDRVTWGSKDSIFWFLGDQIAEALTSKEKIRIPPGESYKITVPFGGTIDEATRAETETGSDRHQMRLSFHDGIVWEGLEDEKQVTTLTSPRLQWEWP